MKITCALKLSFFYSFKFTIFFKKKLIDNFVAKIIFAKKQLKNTFFLRLLLIFARLLFYGVPQADYLRLARAHNLGELCAVGFVDIFDF